MEPGQVEKILHLGKIWAKERKHVVRAFALYLCHVSTIKSMKCISTSNSVQLNYIDGGGNTSSSQFNQAYTINMVNGILIQLH